MLLSPNTGMAPVFLLHPMVLPNHGLLYICAGTRLTPKRPSATPETGRLAFCQPLQAQGQLGGTGLHPRRLTAHELSFPLATGKGFMALGLHFLAWDPGKHFPPSQAAVMMAVLKPEVPGHYSNVAIQTLWAEPPFVWRFWSCAMTDELSSDQNHLEQALPGPDCS